MPVNYRNLRMELDRQAPEAIYRKVKPLMEAEFADRKGMLLAEFEAHPVTRELNAGPNATSDIINTSRGGNLFSLLGFGSSEKPTEAVRQVLEEDLRLNTSQISREVRANTIVFKIPVRMPSLGDFHKKVAKLSPLQWTSRAFTDMMERGITGLPQYLFDSLRNFGGASRSGTAIQVPHKVRNGSTPPIRYVSDLLASFRDLIAGKAR